MTVQTLPETDLAVFPFCLGGTVFGWTANRAESFAVLDAFADAGGNFVDTADVYSAWAPGHHGGESESIIGEWLSRRGDRARWVIATKVAMHPQRPGLSAANIRAACDESLARLRTDHIDLYYAHREDPATPLEETLHAFDDLIRAGKVRHIAASQFSAARLIEAAAIADRDGVAKFRALQTMYNVLEREKFEGELRDVCVRLKLPVLPFFGLARGYLTGKYRGGAAGESARAEGALEFANPRGERVLDVLESVARARGVSIAVIALAWLRARPCVAFPLASARTPAQLADLLRAATLTLDADEIARIDRASER